MIYEIIFDYARGFDAWFLGPYGTKRSGVKLPGPYGEC
jgi:hypothetical protein